MAFESLTDRLAGVFKKLRGHGKLTEADIKAAMREVRMALLEADVNYKVAKDFCARVSERAMGQEVMESLTPAQQVVKIVNEELVALMGGEEAPRLIVKNKGQTIIMLCGLQGNGKTTHAAKLAKYYIKQGRRPMLVACDIYRPAAIDQLQVVGKQAGAPVFTLPGEKPPAIAKKALAHAKDYGNDIVILDTAGRLQIDEVLMQELVDIKEAVPVDETLLVVDATQGIEAQTLANVYMALEHNLETIPVINKIDLPSAQPEEVKKEIEDVIGLDASEAPLVSAKTGENCRDVLEAIVKHIPAPTGDESAPLQALIFDAFYDNYRGAISSVRVKAGSVKVGDVDVRDYDIETLRDAVAMVLQKNVLFTRLPSTVRLPRRTLRLLISGNILSR